MDFATGFTLSHEAPDWCSILASINGPTPPFREGLNLAPRGGVATCFPLDLNTLPTNEDISLRVQKSFLGGYPFLFPCPPKNRAYNPLSYPDRGRPRTTQSPSTFKEHLYTLKHPNITKKLTYTSSVKHQKACTSDTPV